jgi:hypothetical protein
VLVNLGGEPERDDSGLPPVDIEVPDDARELDRDVQAYRRELRALRRRQRRMRLHLPLTHDGIVLPLLASCLVLALIAGTLLTVFTAGPGGDLSGATQKPTIPASSTSPTTDSTQPATSPPVSSPPVSNRAASKPADSPTAAPGVALPDKAVRFDGARTRLRTLVPAVLALVPAGCDCTSAVRRLARQASAAGVKLYLVGAGHQLASVRELAAQAPRARAVTDVTGALYAAYPHTGLTALLASKDGSVVIAELPSPKFQLAGQLSALSGTIASASQTPVPPTTTAATAPATSSPTTATSGSTAPDSPAASS